MAIYNNRLVTLTQPIKIRTSIPDMISVRYADGQTFTVSSSQVKFTKEEKKAMMIDDKDIKDGVNTKTGEPVDNIQVATDEELEAARTGVLPSTHPDIKAQADILVKQEKAKEENQKSMDKAKVEATKAYDQAKSDQAKVDHASTPSKLNPFASNHSVAFKKS